MLSNARDGDNLVGSHFFLYLTAILLIKSCRTMNMPVLTLLHLTLQITFVRWLLITIHQHLMCWTLQNILVSFTHNHVCF